MKLHQTARMTLGAAALLAAVSAAPKTAQAASLDGPLTRTLASHSRTGWTSAIARSAAPLTSVQQAQITALGADVTRHLTLIHSVALRVPTRRLARLAALPFITHLSYDGVTEKCDAFTVGSSLAGTAYAQYKLDGTGIGVAVVDSGVHIAPDLDTTATSGVHRVVGSFNAMPYQNTSFNGVQFPLPQGSLPYDLYGHGTHVAGIIAGNGAWSSKSGCTQTYYGIARNARIVDVRVLDESGAGTVSGVVAGLQWVVANKAAYNIRVINLSLGHPVGESYTTDPMCQAVEAAWRAGIVVVCAAGNGGRLNSNQTSGVPNEGWDTNYGSINSPGNDPYVITVGATKQNILSSGAVDTNRADDKIATYSSRGPSRLDLILKPDLVAPGNRVVSTDVSAESLGKSSLDNHYHVQLPWQNYAPSSATAPGAAYAILSGTSMATPVVSGAVALMLQKDPTLTPDTVKARLMVSADKWGASQNTADAFTYGAGYLNIPAALSSNAHTNGEYAISPSVTLKADNTIAVNDDHAFYGYTSIISKGTNWGGDHLWNGVSDLRAAWGTCAIWGTSTSTPQVTDSHAIWGKSVWGDHAIWGLSTTATDLAVSNNNGQVFNGE